MPLVLVAAVRVAPALKRQHKQRSLLFWKTNNGRNSYPNQEGFGTASL